MPSRKRKKRSRAKKPSIISLRKKAYRLAQKLARLSQTDKIGYGRCVSCNKRLHWKKADGGHFIPKKKSAYWALDSKNIHFQCKGCNGFGMRSGIAAQEYTLWMIEEYGLTEVQKMLKSAGRDAPFMRRRVWLERFIADTNRAIAAELERLD